MSDASMCERPIHVLGVDPGLQGGWAVVRVDHQRRFELVDGRQLELCSSLPWVSLARAPTAKSIPRVLEILDLLSAVARVDAVAVESVWSRPGQSSIATFTQAQLYGQLIGALTMTASPTRAYFLVPPMAWMYALGVPQGLDALERKSEVAARLLTFVHVPNLSLLVGPRGGLRHGVSDAIGVAWFVAQQLVRRPDGSVMRRSVAIAGGEDAC